jgi:hypothetical protein
MILGFTSGYLCQISGSFLAGVGFTIWQGRQTKNPNTGADVTKAAALAVYSRYWKA